MSTKMGTAMAQCHLASFPNISSSEMVMDRSSPIHAKTVCNKNSHVDSLVWLLLVVFRPRCSEGTYHSAGPLKLEYNLN